MTLFFGIWMIVGFLVFATVIGLIVWLAVTLARRTTSAPAGGGGSALDIARERYARGEITREEFQRLKEDLS